VKEAGLRDTGTSPKSQNDQETYRGNPTGILARTRGTAGTTLESTAAPRYTVFMTHANFMEGIVVFLVL